MQPAPSHSLWEINRADGLGMKGQRLDTLGFGKAQVMAGWALDTLLWNSRGGVTPPPAAPPRPLFPRSFCPGVSPGHRAGRRVCSSGERGGGRVPSPREAETHTPLGTGTLQNQGPAGSGGVGPAPSRFSRPKTQGLLGSSLWVQGRPRSREEVVRCWENTGEHGPPREACSADPGRRYPQGGG